MIKQRPSSYKETSEIFKVTFQECVKFILIFFLIFAPADFTDYMKNILRIF